MGHARARDGRRARGLPILRRTRGAHAARGLRLAVGETLALQSTVVTCVVVELGGVVLHIPTAGRDPYECLVAPIKHEDGGFESPLLGTGLELAAEALRRLRDAEGPRPANLWLHERGH